MTTTAGDAVTIDWEVQNPAGDIDDYVNVFPVGTNDFNRSQQQTVSKDEVGEGDVRGESRFVANRSGVMPLEFFAGGIGNASDLGPYNFTAYVSHALVLGVKTNL